MKEMIGAFVPSSERLYSVFQIVDSAQGSVQLSSVNSLSKDVSTSERW